MSIRIVCLCCVLLHSKIGRKERSLTIDSDLAITITVTSGEESLGLLVSQGSGSSREVLQEQPGGRNNRGLINISVYSDLAGCKLLSMQNEDP